MRWEQIEEALAELGTEREYDGYFCSITDAVSISILESVKKIHGWATSEYIKAFLAKEFGLKRIPCYWRLFSLFTVICPKSLNQCMKTGGVQVSYEET